VSGNSRNKIRNFIEANGSVDNAYNVYTKYYNKLDDRTKGEYFDPNAQGRNGGNRLKEMFTNVNTSVQNNEVTTDENVEDYSHASEFMNVVLYKLIPEESHAQFSKETPEYKAKYAEELARQKFQHQQMLELKRQQEEQQRDSSRFVGSIGYRDPSDQYKRKT
jgi:hypothetical protein